jgi:hypothetical protein
MDDSVYVKVIAANVYGDSAYSDVGNGAAIWIVPEAPINLQNDATATDAFKIRFTWDEGIENGGTPVIDYTVMFDQSTGDYVLLAEKVVDRYY